LFLPMGRQNLESRRGILARVRRFD
jgi:hypothetical protein